MSDQSADPLLDPAGYFDEMAPKYGRLKEEVEFALENELHARGIKFHSLNVRLKEKRSYLEKISRKEYRDPQNQVEDVVGARVVCLFTSDLPRLQSLVREVFKVLHEEDKVEEGSVDAFGYMSIHYVCALSETNSGPRYTGLERLKFEIQCRTILMDAWANVSHYLAYKGDASIPKGLRKDFHALAGLFYVADKHFELFFQESKDSQAQAVEAVADARQAKVAPINRDTVLALLAAKYPERVEDNEAYLEAAAALSEELNASGYDTIDQVEKDLDRAHPAVLAFERDHPPSGVVPFPKYTAVGLARQALPIANLNYRQYREDLGVARGYENYEGLLLPAT